MGDWSGSLEQPYCSGKHLHGGCIDLRALPMRPCRQRLSLATSVQQASHSRLLELSLDSWHRQLQWAGIMGAGTYILYSDVRLAAHTARGQRGRGHGAEKLLQRHAQAQQSAVTVQAVES